MFSRPSGWESLCLVMQPSPFDSVVCTCRRLHLPLEAVQDSNSGLLEQLAVQQKSQLAQVVHEAEAAALALAVLVRLTAHAGSKPLVIALYKAACHLFPTPVGL